MDNISNCGYLCTNITRVWHTSKQAICRRICMQQGHTIVSFPRVNQRSTIVVNVQMLRSMIHVVFYMS